MIQVVVDKNQVIDVVATNSHNFDDFDFSILDSFDREEHQSILSSYVEYVRNGNRILEPEYQDTYIVWMDDGSYALEYNIVIKLESNSAYSD